MQTVLISIITSVVVSALGAWIAYFVERKKQFFALQIKARAEMTEDWKNAHLKLYKNVLAYKNYINLFTEGGNEFMESEDIANFAPLRKWNSLYDFINDNSIFFSEELTASIETFLNNNNLASIALAYASGDMEDIPFPVESLEKSMSECVELMDKIKIETGVSLISFKK
ncbi:hypothetical protein C2D64_07065 [Listeria ivanovii]|uniref:hypothetical protein n=1 Tax=Listeria ivanovii TaxID=1638 RepID=UPI000DAA063C|nr:hypothetical protein [Listeria ivanovii]PZG34158.1 hypothetical protein C2D64_07065 [Listeria ivanovii]PZG48346.1 hypothetical protein C2D66_04750 [Listeria ivanovii]PZH11902.1 hypothetical protein C2D65_07015 [Listeria ivanovii]